MHVEPVTTAMCDRFITLMESAARQELGIFGQDVLNRAAKGSLHTFAGIVDDDPAFIGGVNSEGCVWMVSTPAVAKARKFYLRTTRAQTEVMQAMFPTLWSYVDVRYTRSLRWLEWLGFSIGDAVEVMGRMACKVERRA